MTSEKHPKDKSFTIFRSAAEEALTKSAADEAPTKRSELERRENEGGHMSATSGRVGHVPGSDLPFVVTMTHHECGATEHLFATMREAEAFIERNTPVLRPALSCLYDRPASDFGAPQRSNNGGHILRCWHEWEFDGSERRIILCVETALELRPGSEGFDSSLLDALIEKATNMMHASASPINSMRIIPRR